jgi:hypothetical protein
MPKNPALRVGSTVKVVNPASAFYEWVGTVTELLPERTYPVTVAFPHHIPPVGLFALWELLEVDA